MSTRSYSADHVDRMLETQIAYAQSEVRDAAVTLLDTATAPATSVAVAYRRAFAGRIPAMGEQLALAI